MNFYKKYPQKIKNMEINEKNREYEYQGLVVNGFAMIFFTFILVPAILIVSSIVLMDPLPGLAITLDAVFGVIFILGCVGYFVRPDRSGCHLEDF